MRKSVALEYYQGFCLYGLQRNLTQLDARTLFHRTEIGVYVTSAEFKIATKRKQVTTT